jgi:hypothetical protein
MKSKRTILTCPECRDKIYSKHRHDFVQCSCEKYFIDGGSDYIRIGGEDAIKYLSEEEIDEDI